MNFSILGVPWERIKRRIKLMGGSYRHPDGTIEFDFEVDAGISPDDDKKTKKVKLATYYAKQRFWQRVMGAIVIGLVGYAVCEKLGFETLESAASAIAVAGGLVLLTNGRNG